MMIIMKANLTKDDNVEKYISTRFCTFSELDEALVCRLKQNWNLIDIKKKYKNAHDSQNLNI